MKYVVVCPDGAADWPLAELDNKTPLEAAGLPNLARMAAEGVVGRTQHALEDVGNGSDVCCMSLLGFNPAQYHTGRAPLEAKSLGLNLNPNQIAVRVNTVTVEHGVMVDYSAGHITTEESKQLIDDLAKVLDTEGRHFYAGVQYRHILLLDRAEDLDAVCTAPHDITGRAIDAHLPKGNDAAALLEWMEVSKKVFTDHPVNRARSERHDNSATQIWLWGHGRKPSLPSFEKTYGVRGAMISAVDLLKSLGMYLDLKVLDVPGITGFTDTDYAAKASHAIASLADHDLVFLHVEAPDECGHMGDYKQKMEALRRIDDDILAPLTSCEAAQAGELRVLLCPDHSTPCALKAHATELIPFLVWGAGVESNGLSYTETDARRSTLTVEKGHELIGKFLRGDLNRAH